MIKKKLLFPVIILLLFSQFLTGQGQAEMQELRNKIEALAAMPNKPVTEAEAQRIITSFRQRFGRLEFLIRRRPGLLTHRRPGTDATAEYNSLLTDVNATEKSWSPSIAAPSDAEINALQNKINQAKTLSAQKRAANFDQRINSIESRMSNLRRLARRNRNEEARNIYNQLNTEIDTIINEINAYNPPRDKIRHSRNISDRQQAVSSTTTYSKNISGTVIKAYQFGNFRFNLDLSRPVINAELRITGSTNMYERRFKVGIQINRKSIPVNKPTFSTQKGIWIVPIPQNLLKNGHNSIRFIVSRPKRNNRFQVNLDEMVLVINHNN